MPVNEVEDGMGHDGLAPSYSERMEEIWRKDRFQSPQVACEHIMRVVGNVAGRKLLLVLEEVAGDAAKKRDVALAAIEAIEGFPGYGMLRNADGVRLKDHPAWVAFYNSVRSG